MNHVKGVHADRLKNGPWEDRERAFAEAWAEEYQPSVNRDLLAQLVNHPNYASDVYPTERDRVVAATVIQWLGSNVGMGFLDSALRRVGLRVEGRYSDHLEHKYGPRWNMMDGPEAREHLQTDGGIGPVG